MWVSEKTESVIASPSTAWWDMLTVPLKERGLQDDHIRRVGTRTQDPVQVLLGLEHMEHTDVTGHGRWNKEGEMKQRVSKAAADEAEDRHSH